MIVHFGLDNLRVEWSSATLCIGTFDGVHLGHRAVVHQAVEQARGNREPCIIVTFDRHPAAILRPEKCPEALGTLEQNVIALRALGASACLIMPFNAELSRWSAERFYETVMVQGLRASRIVVGHDFAFGHQRHGTPEWLAERVETHVVPPFTIGGQRVSSSAIRTAVAEGRVEDASALLGRPYGLAGVVVKGQQLGRTLGYPTVNIARTMRTVTPADGVYACRVRLASGVFDAAASIGFRPAVGGTARTVEAFLLDYPGEEVYGQSLEIEFLARIREERNFDSLDALKVQMADDVERIREVCAKKSAHSGIN